MTRESHIRLSAWGTVTAVVVGLSVKHYFSVGGHWAPQRVLYDVAATMMMLLLLNGGLLLAPFALRRSWRVKTLVITAMAPWALYSASVAVYLATEALGLVDSLCDVWALGIAGISAAGNLAVLLLLLWPESRGGPRPERKPEAAASEGVSQPVVASEGRKSSDERGGLVQQSLA
jgi:hypothetical protein